MVGKIMTYPQVVNYWRVLFLKLVQVLVSNFLKKAFGINN